MVEAFFEEFVGNDVRLGQTVDAVDDFEVNQVIPNVVGEVVFGDEFLGDVIETDAHNSGWSRGVLR